MVQSFEDRKRVGMVIDRNQAVGDVGTVKRISTAMVTIDSINYVLATVASAVVCVAEVYLIRLFEVITSLQLDNFSTLKRCVEIAIVTILGTTQAFIRLHDTFQRTGLRIDIKL